MKNRRSRSAFAAALLTAMLGTTALTPAHAQDRADAAQGAREFAIEAQPLMTALLEFSRQTNAPVVAPASLTAGREAPAVQGRMDDQAALAMLLDGSGLRAVRGPSGGWAVTVSQDPQSGSAAGDGAEVEALIVTAQKREENIQDVPIAISAFTSKDLEEQKIEGGFDLLKAIPNVTFSKNNFSSYNFSIRGIGTKAVSATTDPGVAVSFNNASLIQNRLFEQEYFDVERVEVLRGPQGTLYGRNATAGVINVISAKPDMDEFKGWVKGEVGNYQTKRVSAMVNVPLAEDKLAIRFAGALTDRQGYDFNDTTKNAVNGRDLWSARLSLAFNPTNAIRTSLVWERFNEDDNRSRTGKQLCKYDPSPTHIGSYELGETLDGGGTPYINPTLRFIEGGALFSQGCQPVSLYDDDAFQTPNGLALPFVGATMYVQGACAEAGGGSAYAIARRPEFPYHPVSLLKCLDPYGGKKQSHDLRVINSLRDPIYRAKADVIQLNIDVDVGDSLMLTSQTTYNKDSVYSFQDYNRFNTAPVFQDLAGTVAPVPFIPGYEYLVSPSPWVDMAPGGIFCDPQIGCSNTMVVVDISEAKGTQWIQELRLASDFDGPLNFSAGANYTRFKVQADYYVMANLLTALAMSAPFNYSGTRTTCNIEGFLTLLETPIDIGDPSAGCPYIDPNPVESINGEGHNYFRSKNPYKLSSAAAFGEIYWQIAEDLKLTAGLRYTDDRKTFTPVPSQLLLSTFLLSGGEVSRGYPADPDLKQRWGEWTGRLGVDWKPELSFTEQTMLYAFYSRGYKGGGANPPRIGFATESPLGPPVLFPIAQNASPTFKPEFVNAFEVGAKNTLLGGGLIFNTGAFFYDYKDYQVSKVVDRTVANENYDAKVWGLEFETVVVPTTNLRFVANLGYLDTEIGKGARSIDIMNRTQSNPNYVVVKPWLQLPSNCVVPLPVAEYTLPFGQGSKFGLCGGWAFAAQAPYDPTLEGPYDPANYPELNGGAGIAQNLEGNELPNSPHWTANIGAQYGWEPMEGWEVTLRGDAYWQSQSWARVYNAVNDKLHGWYNANLSLWIENDDGLKIELYAKNLLDKTPITDSFINSDDTALTTNVFVLDPRLIGLSLRKEF